MNYTRIIEFQLKNNSVKNRFEFFCSNFTYTRAAAIIHFIFMKFNEFASHNRRLLLHFKRNNCNKYHIKKMIFKIICFYTLSIDRIMVLFNNVFNNIKKYMKTYMYLFRFVIKKFDVTYFHHKITRIRFVLSGEYIGFIMMIVCLYFFYP